MSEDKVYMPSGAGGLVRFADEEDEIFKLKPQHVVIFSAAIIALEMILRFLPK